MSYDDKSRFQGELRACLTGYVAQRAQVLRDVDASVGALADAALAAVEGGKRIRGSLCYWAWRGAGRPHDRAVVAAAAALELFHAGALVHDDVMDRSDERRGRLSSHRRFAGLCRGAGLVGDPVRFGDSAAVLLGDLLMSWSGELLGRCDVAPDVLAETRGVFDLMRTEAMAGQYLDLWQQVQPRPDYAASDRVQLYKSAKYSAEQPLLLGATLAGAPAAYRCDVAALGRDVGEAFQLRDDVLGVFGDPALTGKPVGDDLREGKKTVLMALAHHRASPAARARIERCLGPDSLTDHDLGFLEETIVATGALAAVESRIDELHDRAVDRVRTLGLDHGLDPEVQEALVRLTGAATRRVA